MITRSQIIETARSFVGTPYHHQGRLPGVGMDCVGMIVCVARALNLAVEDYTRYSANPDGSLLDRVEASLVRIPTELAIAGDVVMFYIQQPTLPQHLAILSDVGMIHAFDGGSRRVVEVSLSETWRKRIVAAFKFPDLQEDK